MDLKNVYVLGQIFAVLEHTAPRGLTMSEKSKMATMPYIIFPSAMQRIQPWRYESINDKLAQLIDQLDEMPKKPLGLEAQGQFFLGYYHERKALEDVPRPEEKNIGAPKTEDRIAWDTLTDEEWALSDAELARALGCSRQAVSKQRKQYGKPSSNAPEDDLDQDASPSDPEEA